MNDLAAIQRELLESLSQENTPMALSTFLGEGEGAQGRHSEVEALAEEQAANAAMRTKAAALEEEIDQLTAQYKELRTPHTARTPKARPTKKSPPGATARRPPLTSRPVRPPLEAHPMKKEAGQAQLMPVPTVAKEEPEELVIEVEKSSLHLNPLAMPTWMRTTQAMSDTAICIHI